MSKISRQENKARYKTGMYPTQQDFENVFDSYVHKDDIVPAEQVKSGDKTIIQLINELSERTHTHQIADVEGLQTFINEVNNFLGTVDASNETINRWKELESFLQGITDTENLLTLLQQYRQEILSAVEGQYLMQVPDLDAYTDAPTGKIVQYIGETTDKYTHGFIYEFCKSPTPFSYGPTVIAIQETSSASSNSRIGVGTELYPRDATFDLYSIGDGNYFTKLNPEVGDVMLVMTKVTNAGNLITKVAQGVDGNTGKPSYIITFKEDNGQTSTTVFTPSSASLLKCYTYYEPISGESYFGDFPTDVCEFPYEISPGAFKHYCIRAVSDFEGCSVSKGICQLVPNPVSLPPSWQPIKVQNVID